MNRFVTETRTLVKDATFVKQPPKRGWRPEPPVGSK